MGDGLNHFGWLAAAAIRAPVSTQQGDVGWPVQRFSGDTRLSRRDSIQHITVTAITLSLLLIAVQQGRHP